jgi:Tfp pilus assembly protein PilF
MPGSRLDTLKEMLAQNPSASFVRYGLAMEYRNTGDLPSAMREFESLMKDDPEYAATYLHAGQTLERLGKLDEARQVYLAGIDVTSRKGEAHARSELEAALAMLS